MRKRLLSLGMAALMGAALVGCGSSSEKTVSNDYITVTGYNKLQILKVDTEEVTDDDVTETIDSNLEASQTTQEVDREAKDGDIANIDYTGKIDGEEFDGGSSEGYDLELGSDTFITANGDYKGFEEQIVGHKAGDEFDIEVKFPDDYSSEDLAGKVATFTIKLNSVSEYVEAELTDDWVKENSDESETVEEYKEEIKQQLTDENEETARETLQNEVLEALQKQIEVKQVPEDEAAEIKDSLVEQYENYATMYGMEFADFLEQLMGMTEDEFDEQAQTVAEQSAEVYMACELIADAENLTPTDEEYSEEYDSLAEEYGFDSGDDLIEQYGEDDIKKSILQEKVTDYLIENAEQLSEEEMATATEASSEDTTSAESATEQ